MLGLIFGLLLLISFGIYEFQKCKISRKKIPMIIHINGTRGKSSVTRLIAAGLRAGGKRIIAKTTGSAPALIFENGSETPIIRHHGANIKEQIKIIKFAAKRKIDILVLECMAVTPEYQWVTEHEIVQSNIGIITNSRLDHLDVMGPGLKNVTLSLCNTIPRHGILFTAEKKVFPLIKKEAKKMHCEIIQSDDSGISKEDMQGFSHIEHKDNVALSLKVCEHFGIDKKTALEGMYTAQPDIGAMEIYLNKSKDTELHFVHAFAANDPESTEFVINSVKELYPRTHAVAIVLNTRDDRIFRSKQLIRMLKEVHYDHLYLIGKQTNTIYSYAMTNKLAKKKITDCGWVTGEELTKYVVKLPAKEILMLGIGNIGGNGGIIVNYYSEEIAMKIFVGNMPKDVEKKSLKALFSDYGDVKTINIHTDKINDELKAYAFIDMPKKEAWKAISALDNKEYFGNVLSVHQARFRNHDRRGPNRLGGRRKTDLPEIKSN